jgi:hypothetical protein
LGAYVAYLVHAGVDWDWEMTAVTITALLCGTAALVRSRSDGDEPLSWRSRIALVGLPLVLAAVAFVGVNGNGALANAREEANAGHWSASEAEADKAGAWMPWSSDPWQMAGEAQLARGDRAAARGSFLTAIDKDPNDSELWQGLAYASKGPARREAVVHALRLNPRDPGMIRLARSLGIETVVAAAALSSQEARSALR